MFTAGAILLAALSDVGASCDVLEQAARVTKALAREENAECATDGSGISYDLISVEILSARKVAEPAFAFRSRQSMAAEAKWSLNGAWLIRLLREFVSTYNDAGNIEGPGVDSAQSPRPLVSHFAESVSLPILPTSDSVNQMFPSRSAATLQGPLLGVGMSNSWTRTPAVLTSAIFPVPNSAT